MNSAQKKPYFFLSFIPAVGYWILETYYSLTIALIGGLLLALVEIVAEKIFTKKIHTISKLNFFLILVLGGISLWAQEGVWFKLQPTFTGYIMFVFLSFYRLKKKSIMMEMIHEMNLKKVLPDQVYAKLEWHMAVFLSLYSTFMIYISLFQETNTWIFWKTGGFYLTFFVFMMVEFLFLRVSIKGRV